MMELKQYGPLIGRLRQLHQETDGNRRLRLGLGRCWAQPRDAKKAMQARIDWTVRANAPTAPRRHGTIRT